MRFTSLIVELIRARPRLVVWLVVLVQAALWLILPMLLYRSPPGDLATVLAFGREYQVGTWSRSAAGVLARRHRVSRRRQPHVRRLSAGAALRGRDVLGALISWRAPSSAGSRRCSRCC